MTWTDIPVTQRVWSDDKIGPYLVSLLITEDGQVLITEDIFTIGIEDFRLAGWTPVTNQDVKWTEV